MREFDRMTRFFMALLAIGAIHAGGTDKNVSAQASKIPFACLFRPAPLPAAAAGEEDGWRRDALLLASGVSRFLSHQSAWQQPRELGALLFVRSDWQHASLAGALRCFTESRPSANASPPATPPMPCGSATSRSPISGWQGLRKKWVTTPATLSASGSV